MDALGWLARTSEFVTEYLCQKMLTSFRESEVPLRNMEMRRRYKHELTASTVVVTVCSILAEALNMREYLP